MKMAKAAIATLFVLCLLNSWTEADRDGYTCHNDMICIPNSYNRYQPPNRPTEVQFSFKDTIEKTLEKVDDYEFTLTLFAQMTMVWQDQRLRYNHSNLKELRVTALDESMEPSLWKPKVAVKHLKSTDTVYFMRSEGSGKKKKSRTVIPIGKEEQIFLICFFNYEKAIPIKEPARVAEVGIGTF